MKSIFFRSLIVVTLLLVTVNVEAKKYHFELKPMGNTEALLPADSIAFLNCPVFKGGKIECFPDNARAMVADFKNEKEAENALYELRTYFAEHPLEGEYAITAGDLQAKKLIGYTVDIRHHSAKHDAAVNEAKYWGKSLLLAVLTIIFGSLTIVLFSTQRAKTLCRIGGLVTGILTLIFGLMAILAIAALAFKYICIVLGCALVLVFGLSVLGNFAKKQKQAKEERAQQSGWVVNGTVYASKDAADEAARNTGSDVHFKS